MDMTSPNLNMPYLAPAQAQKHATHNEALRQLDAIVQLSVSAVSDTPPGSPAEGQRVIIGALPEGEFDGHALKVAAFQDGAWAFYAAKIGWRAYVEDVAELHIFDGVEWQVFTAGNSNEEDGVVLDSAPVFGVNASADSFNRLVVKGPASLLDNEGAGHQLKINKAAEGDTASLLFQSGYSGHAEMGLTGGQNFHIKTSGDGATFKDSLIADAQTGAVDFPHGINSAQKVRAVDSGAGPESYYGFANNTTQAYTRTNYTFVQNRVFFHPLYVDRISVFQGGFIAQYAASSTEGAKMRVGLYKLGEPNGDAWALGERIIDLGSQLADVSGHKYFTPTAPITLEAGWYAVAIGVNGVDAKVRAMRTYQPELQKFIPFNQGNSSDIRVSGPSHYLFNVNAEEIETGFSQVFPSSSLTPIVTVATYGLVPFISKWAA